MTYQLRYSKEVVTFFRSLCPDDQAEVKALLNTIRLLPEHGKPVRSMPGLAYQKSYSLDKSRWPSGIRVLYHVFEAEVIIAVVDVGDHNRAASCPEGGSVYQDERKVA